MKKNLIYVMTANIFYMIIVASTNFILPRFTTMETYAAVKSYTLYISTYAEIVTLGYLQGMYIRYGGKKIEDIPQKEIGANLLTFIIFMIPIAGAVSIIGIIRNDVPFTIFGAGLLASEIVMYFQLLYQATGDFKAYGIALNASKILVFASYIVLIFGFPREIQVLYIAISPLSCVFVALYLGIQLNKRIGFIQHISLSLRELKVSIKQGFTVMLGNFVSSFFTTIDRWFVKVLMMTVNFALYSFAVSLENIVNTFMRPITISMYNYFCKKPANEDVKKIKDYSIMYSFFIITAAYPAKWILENFMTDYLPATSIIFSLFVAQGISAVIKGIYINKYKADGEQNKYLFQLLGILLIAIFFNAIFYYFFRSMQAIAIATLVSNILWFCYCEYRESEIRCEWSTYLAISVMIITYLITGQYFNSIVGCCIYIIAGLGCSFLFMRNTFFYLLSSAYGIIRKK